MRPQSPLEISQAFLDVLWADTPPCDHKLAAALDCLLAATHSVAETSGVDDFTPYPDSDWRALYDELGKRFPNFGHYSVASPLEANEMACFTGDAIDDLADITKELGEVLWRGHNISHNDAAWHFRFSYEIHWGLHARQLALYLHARITAAR